MHQPGNGTTIPLSGNYLKTATARRSPTMLWRAFAARWSRIGSDMSARRHISLTKKLASALLTIRVEENGKLVPFIDHETAKTLTAAQIISLFHFDHYPI